MAELVEHNQLQLVTLVKQMEPMNKQLKKYVKCANDTIHKYATDNRTKQDDKLNLSAQNYMTCLFSLMMVYECSIN